MKCYINSMNDKPSIPEKLLSSYNPKDTEARIYKMWEESGFFNPDVCVEKGVTAIDAESFTMVLPPPNVTGRLHLGHALEHSLQDALMRYQRMRGKKTLWVPGTDHAAIATQSRFEKDFTKQTGKSRHDFDRDTFFNMINDFALGNQKDMENQMRLFGSSLDWSREAFTLDDKRSKAVQTAFKRMYNEGLIYRGYRVVNWDPRGQTTIADDEIVYEERDAKLYTFKYSKDFPISISTTRPETKVGDTAVAVHPRDERYKEFVGKEYDAVFCGVPIHIKIIADETVEMEFGTGALGVTPAHSTTDWEIAQKHSLPLVPVINEIAKMTVGDERILGKKTTEARDVIVEWLRSEGLLEKEEAIKQNVSTAERTGGIIEPLPKFQWFVDVNKPVHSRGGKTLKDLMREPMESGQIKILPEHFARVYTNWIENLRDWCISRQIIYGHRVPAYFDLTDPDNQNILVCFKKKLQLKNYESIQGDAGVFVENQNDAREKIITASSAKGLVELVETGCTTWEDIKKNATSFEIYENLNKPIVLLDDIKIEPHYIQDFDTLDTWFSSGLWTFSTLGWPDETPDMKAFHPTSFMNPGYEILFFWVARMTMMSEYLLGTIPFETVYLHGIVRDSKGLKFSKSLRNGVEPEEIIGKYGTDALRMSMVVGIGPGSDINFDEQKVKAYSKFANKIWNATRFVIENTMDVESFDEANIDADDRPHLDELNTLVSEITKEMNEFKFYIVSEKLYHYFWHTFADIHIERAKMKIAEGGAGALSAKTLLRLETDILLRVLHPFMPFITEELWSLLPAKSSEQLLMVTSWPSQI